MKTVHIEKPHHRKDNFNQLRNFSLFLQIMDQFKPNIIFSGHSHLSRIITYPPQNIENLVDNRVVNVKLNNLNVAENYRNFTEIVVPTSSYRMGVPNIGYGYAVIGNMLLF